MRCSDRRCSSERSSPLSNRGAFSGRYRVRLSRSQSKALKISCGVVFWGSQVPRHLRLTRCRLATEIQVLAVSGVMWVSVVCVSRLSRHPFIGMWRFPTDPVQLMTAAAAVSLGDNQSFAIWMPTDIVLQLRCDFQHIKPVVRTACRNNCQFP